MQWASTIFPILAPLPVTRAAPALAFYNFIRTFAQVLPHMCRFCVQNTDPCSQTWGVTISATILQNELKRNLPAAFVQDFPSGVEIAYAVIPQIPSLEEPLRSEVRAAFAQSMATIWKVLAGLSGAGFLASFLLREVPMQTYTDEKFGLQQQAADARGEPVRLEEARASVVTAGEEEDKKDAGAVEMEAVNTSASLAV